MFRILGSRFRFGLRDSGLRDLGWELSLLAVLRTLDLGFDLRSSGARWAR